MRNRTVDFKASNSTINLNRYHVRLEALMPRIIFPSSVGSLSQSIHSNSHFCWSTGPDFLILQVDQIIIQSLSKPLSSCAALNLSNFLNRFETDGKINENIREINNPFSKNSNLHIPVNWSKFRELAQSDRINYMNHELNESSNEQCWCLHCPNLWIEFLTVVDIRSPENPFELEKKIYRQSVLEPTPLTLWSLIPINLYENKQVLSVLLDFDSKLSPFQKPSIDHSNLPPIKINLGLESYSWANLNRIPKFNIKLPNLMDHILFLFGLSGQLMYVRENLDSNAQKLLKIQQTSKNTSMNENFNLQLIYSFVFSLKRLITFNLNLKQTDLFESDFKKFFLLEKNSHNSYETNNSFPNNDNSNGDSNEVSINHTSSKNFINLHNLNLNNNQNSNLIFNLNQVQSNRSMIDLCNHDDLWNNDNPIFKNTSNSSDHTSINADNFSIIRNLSDNQSLCDSSDDWTKPYELFNENSSTNLNLHDIDNNSNCFDEQEYYRIVTELKNFKSQSKFLIAEEIGSEAIELDQNAINSKFTVANTTTSSSSTNCNNTLSEQQSNHIDSQNYLNVQHQQKYKYNVLFEIYGLEGEIDSTNNESRFWIRFTNLNLSTNSQTFSLKKDQESIDSNKTANYLWSVIASFGGNPTLYALNEDSTLTNHYPWIYVDIKLMQCWQLNMPLSLKSALMELWNRFTDLGGFSLLMDLLNIHRNDNNKSNTLLSVKIAMRISLEHGSLRFNLLSDSNDDQSLFGYNKIIKQIYLQKGLVISFTESGIINVYSMLTESNEDKQNSIVLNRQSSLNTNITSQSETYHHNILLNHYATENKILKDKIEALTFELNELKSIVNRTDNV